MASINKIDLYYKNKINRLNIILKMNLIHEIQFCFL
jgi:hypothetical protein